MAPDHTQHGRRPHGHRRRGHDRRGPDRRPRAPQPEPEGRDRVDRDRPDLDQLMREIRSRIAERKGVDLSSQQIQDLAARRLEAILAPQGLDPKLMEELRRSAGTATGRPPQPEPVEAFDEASLYASPNGLVRALRALFRPLLLLLLNPKALGGALTAQADRAAKQAEREAEQRRRQSEWNALHYEILRRVVTDAARAEIDLRDLLQRVEALGARVDFGERRIGAVEQTQHQARPSRGSDAPPATADSGEQPSRGDAEGGDGARKRRRRRRGRRSGGPFQPEGGSIGEARPDTDDGADGEEAAEAPESPAGGWTEAAAPAPEAAAPSPETAVVPAVPARAATPDAPPVPQVWAPPSRPEPADRPAAAPSPIWAPEPVTQPPAPVAETRPLDTSSPTPASDPGSDPSPTDR